LLKVDWARADAREIGAIIGRGVWLGFAICAVVGWLAFVLSERSRRIATGITCAALLLLTLGDFARGATSEATAKRIVARVLDDLEAQRRTYEAMTPQIKDAVSNPHLLKLPDVVTRRLWVVRQAIKTNQALLDRGNAAEDEIARALR